MGGGKTKTSSSSKAPSTEKKSGVADYMARTGKSYYTINGQTVRAKDRASATSLANEAMGGDVAPTTPDTMVQEEVQEVPPAPEQPKQPQPKQPGVETGLVPYEQAQAGLASGGLQGETLKMAEQVLASKYGRGFQAAQAAGITAPQDAGQGRAMVQQYTPSLPDTSTVDMVFSEDPTLNSIMQSITQMLSPDEQKSSLMQDYKRLYRSSGLDEINEELIDAETILDGTEDDIRNEIQTAGGMATESQVQAMTLSRNKGLLKRYNQLFAMKESAQKQLDTMLNLTVQDRQMASERMQNQINAMFKFADFRQQSINAYKETARFALQTMGADGLYSSMSSDPKQVANYERMMGLPSGGLAVAASQAAKTRATESYLQSLQVRKAEQDLGMGVAPGPASSSVINPNTGKYDPTGSLAGFIKASGLKDNAKIQDILGVIAATQKLAERNPEGNFEGLGIITAPIPALSSSEGRTNKADVGAINLKVQQWASGASLTEDQTKKVNELTPRQGETYAQTKDKINGLTNFMLTQAQGLMAAQGVEYNPEEIDYFFDPAEFY